MPNSSNTFPRSVLNSHALETLSTEKEFPNSTNDQVIHTDDWSYATKELLDTLPKTWTRGLLYFLVVFVGIVLPWSMLYKVDETGSARGRLELKGNTVKREADIQGSVAVVKVRVKEGDEVKANQILVELDSKSIRDEIQQNQIKLEGEINRLSQLEIQKISLELLLLLNSNKVKFKNWKNKHKSLKQSRILIPSKLLTTFKKKRKSHNWHKPSRVLML